MLWRFPDTSQIGSALSFWFGFWILLKLLGLIWILALRFRQREK
jgi:hypothetical protein